MGYRSESILAMTKNVRMKAVIANKMFDETNIDKREHGDSIYYFFSSWKWYDSYKIVREIEALMDFIETHLENKEFAFIQIGEDFDDLSQRGDPYMFGMHFSRSIDSPVGELK